MIDLSREKILFKLIFLTITIVFFESCLTIESDIILNSTGTGSMDIIYTLDRGLEGISNLGSGDQIVPLNLSEEYIRSITDRTPGLEYSRYNTDITDSSYIVSVKFNFDNITTLNAILPDENKISIIQEGDENIFSQTIVSGIDKDISPETLSIFKDIFSDHYFKLTIKVPGEIIAIENGTIENGNIGVYSHKFIDVISNGELENWTVRW